MSRLSSLRTGLAVLAISAFGHTVAAQTPSVMDPRFVEFNPSPDHSTTVNGQAVVTRYDLEFYTVGGTQPVRTVNLGKPSPANGIIRVDFTPLLNPWPAPGTTYEGRVAAVGPAGTARSTQSNTFAFSAPCSWSISPASVSVGGAASNGTVTVTSAAGCAWTATSSAAWLTITSGASGSGNGAVLYAVAANGTTTQRSGTLNIGGQTFTVTQSAGCTYTITPSATTVSAGATTGTVGVTTGNSCPWTASSSATWLSITSGATGSGSGAAGYSVAANTGTATRTATATIAGRTFTVTQNGVPCNYSLNPVNTTLGPAAGSGTVGVTSQTGCSWTASSGASWITVTSGASGSGNGQVGYGVTANSGTSSRTGAITIGGQAFNVTQTGQSCTFSISPANMSAPATAATGTINVTSLSGCAWTATTATSWISITSGASGSGNGAVGFSVAANPNVTGRTGTITVGGQTYTVNQAAVACTATLAPLSASVGSGGGSGNVAVTIPAACQWTATSGAAWLTLTSGANGTGNGSVGYSAAANTSTSSRSANLTIAGQTFSVTQAGLTCTYTVTPPTPSVAATAGTGTVTVTSAAGCNWTASSAVSWMSITNGANGSGSGSATYSFSANPTTQTRSGVLTVAGQPVTVTQAAGCGYSITPASASVSAAAGSGTVNVTAGGSCAWTAQSPASWITFSTPTTGTGNGSVGYAVAANNNSSSRSATITVAGQPFVITQAGAACDTTLNPTTQNVAAAGGNGSVDVAVPAGCTWSAVPSANWITVLTGATGSGNGTVTYSVGANPNGTSRNGTLAIGGRLLTINQAASSCTSSLSSTSESFESAGGSRVVSVTIPAGCSWTATSNSAWITVTAGAGPNSSGNGGVTFDVAANSTTAPRTGSLTIAGQTVNVTQTGTCDITLAPTSVSAGSAASTGSVAVTTGAACSWSATSSAAWLSVTGGGTGVGNGNVGYAMTANTTGAARTGSLTIGGRQFSVTQTAASCSVALSPASIALTPGVAFRGITVTAASTCSWTATNTASWITITSGASGTGNGSVFMNIAANNTNLERTATLLIGGQTATITQAGQGCAVALSPLSVTVAATGSNGSITVAASVACTWTATSDSAWITITAGGSATGNGTVQYAVAPNPSSTERSGVITIAGRTFAITQAPTLTSAASCNATLSSSGMTIPSSPLDITVGVSVADGCSWTAASGATWIAPTTPGARVGPGSQRLSIAENRGSASRVGTATIAGKTFQISQAGACQYSASPTTVSVGGTASTAAISVNAGAECAWTAQSPVPWITLNSSSGTGGSTVGLNIAANNTASARSATLSIAGSSVVVNQAAAACSVTVRPASMNVNAKGGDQSIAITTTTGCAWTASAGAAWLALPNGASGTGQGTVIVRVAANTTGEVRVGTVSVGGSTVSISQRSGRPPKAPIGVNVQEATKNER